MTDFKQLVQQRRSHRKFSSEEVSGEDIQLLLRAALMSPTSKGQRAWHFIVVDDRIDLEKMADAKAAGSQFLKDAPLAIVVLGESGVNDYVNPISGRGIGIGVMLDTDEKQRPYRRHRREYRIAGYSEYSRNDGCTLRISHRALYRCT